MMSASLGSDSPELDPVLSALDDSDCREIISELDEPMTASQVADECDLPMSTTYRKLDMLTKASLLAEGTEIRADGHHATRYEVDFDTVELELDEHRTLDVSVSRPIQDPEERLAKIWGEVRQEL
jgi:DNA-binding transcriptional ArsR family regulator